MMPGPAQTAGKVLEKSLPARFEDAEAFILDLRHLLAALGMRTGVFDIELLAREILANAIRHGCQGDPSRSILVHISILADRVRICVSDEGPGFDWRNTSSTLPSPTSEMGRGLYIINTYADTVEFNDAGNTVCVTKTFPSEECT